MKQIEHPMLDGYVTGRDRSFTYSGYGSNTDEMKAAFQKVAAAKQAMEAAEAELIKTAEAHLTLPAQFKVKKVERARSDSQFCFTADAGGLEHAEWINTKALEETKPKEKTVYETLGERYDLKVIFNQAGLSKIEKRRVLGLPDKTPEEEAHASEAPKPSA